MTQPTFTRLVRQLRTSAGPSDRELLDRSTRGGDEDAFAALARRHGRFVLAACRQVLSDPADIDDAFQATFLVLLRKAKSVNWQKSLKSWLYAVAHRVAVHARSNAHRRRAREAKAAERRQTEAPTPDLSWREAVAILHDELNKLPDSYRLPLLLCYLQGESREEAAEQLGWKPGSVKGRLERGRRELAERLARRGITLSAGLLAVVTGHSAAAGGPTPELVRLTVRAAGGTASPAVAALATKGITAMTRSPGKLITAFALTVGLAAAGLRLSAEPTDQPPKEAMPAPAAAAGPGQKPPTEGTLTITGRVLRPDGSPAAGAKLFAPKLLAPQPTRREDIIAERIGEADADGHFRVTLTRYPQARSYLVAHAAGLGVDWIELTGGAPAGEVTLRLVADLPITGRVVNTEGRPVAGVRVSIGAVAVPNGNNLDDYLARWRKSWQDAATSPNKRLFLPLDGVTGAAVSDRDGRFTLAGGGAGRVVDIKVHPTGGVARGSISVVTRPGFDPAPYNQASQNQEPEGLRALHQWPPLSGPDVPVVIEPGMAIAGVVREAGTGKPIPHCGVSINWGFGEGTGTSTGPDGSYRLTGIPKSKSGYNLYAALPKGGTFLGRRAHVEDPEGFTTIAQDIELVKGAVVTGRVIDKQTGKGVRAGVRFAPLTGNPYFGSKPGYDNYRHDRTMQTTDADGRFRLVTIPGPALVMAQAHGGETFQGQDLCPYRNATPDPDHKDVFRHEADDDTWLATTAGGIEFLGIESVVKVIDVKPDGETSVELFADRGVTAALKVEGPDGAPLAGAWVAGLTEHWPITYRLNGPTATIYALDPKKPRTLFLYHPEKKLGGSVTVHGDKKGPAVARLEPVGSVTGRLTEAGGGPLAGATVSVSGRSETGRELYRFANPSGKPVLTDKNGRFTLPGVVPGMPFYLQIQQGNVFYSGKPKLGYLILKPGEERALGDRAVEALR